MKVFALTHKAKTDLHAIALFTEKTWGREQRNLYIKSLLKMRHFSPTTHFYIS